MVGRTTKQMKYSRSCDIQIWWPSVENVALLRHFQPGVHHISMSDSLPCIICIMSHERLCYYTFDFLLRLAPSLHVRWGTAVCWVWATVWAWWRWPSGDREVASRWSPAPSSVDGRSAPTTPRRTAHLHQPIQLLIYCTYLTTIQSKKNAKMYWTNCQRTAEGYKGTMLSNI